MEQARTDRSMPLTRYVSVKEVCSALGISKPTLDRLRRDGLFPPHKQLSKNRVGWPVTDIEAYYAKQVGAVSRLSVSDPDELEPDTLMDEARKLAAKAVAKRTGIRIALVAALVWLVIEACMRL